MIEVPTHRRTPVRSSSLSYLAHGVTTVVQLSGPSGNIPNVAELPKGVARGDRSGAVCSQNVIERERTGAASNLRECGLDRPDGV